MQRTRLLLCAALLLTLPMTAPLAAEATDAASDTPVEQALTEAKTPLQSTEPSPAESLGLELAPEPIELNSCTAQFNCPDGSSIQCTHPTQCFVMPGICAVRCGNSNVVKCNNWPASCEDPCDYSACLGAGGSVAHCEALHCEGFGGPDSP